MDGPGIDQFPSFYASVRRVDVRRVHVGNLDARSQTVPRRCQQRRDHSDRKWRSFTFARRLLPVRPVRAVAKLLVVRIDGSTEFHPDRSDIEIDRQ